ncbi:GntR family transcriptional regulator [Streptomyces sp. NPDC001586]|uniref:GntR family transcriptional regulator n=1 Tax=unclassified Streptomyces TaxID=2593676 RepID=UPI00331A8B3F
MTAAHHGEREQPQQPRYQLLAEDLMCRLGGPDTLAAVPSADEIARRYRVPRPTAQFVRRALCTRLRAQGSPHAVPMTPDARSMPERVAALLRARILNGSLTGRLPNRPDLATEYRVSVDTVGKAVRLLVREGLLLGAARHGTYVLEQTAPTQK